METKIEGIVLSKIPYDERHIIATLLLRTGRKVSVVFYGGRGGGKKQKSSIIELGFMLSVELAHAKTNTEIYHAKEWSIVWHHDLIRLNHNAFYLMCFFLEVINKIAPIENLHDVHEENKEMVGLFASLSNALVHLEKTLKDNAFYIHSHAVIFLTKTLLHLGVFPEREHCTLCGIELQGFNDMYLIAEEGGFACPPCVNQRHSYTVQSGRELWELLGHIAHTKYAELASVKLEYKSLPKMLFHYFCFQFHFEEKDFKTASMVF
ncbi:MAG: recombination protein O N-terminal domain-containing protein [Bdellovibrionales bacterium]|nr:recombination protein O N-terminal domain-containing protein [Bdellovibrionales bacterium]